ncbi:SMP-30/gluconolactonase/LRE family protein [Streptomyces endophyticus]|uniref:SMP-30/gluconolactonase/LRE family protein n=1 Tax=Streptomyces endophyticus TaxID=714166 RepID=A0ABU6EYU9_9ACTN|nr:SMP-30/gluconolactonase/LRE family protein [Streptomyces endophyticus]MEB8336926.1 SMP-30/gluconolactonase/LRE family protein [Streptomyces endophyticus]
MEHPHEPPTLDARAVRAVSPDRLELGEGLRLLDDHSVILVDILAGRLLRLDPAAAPEHALTQIARLPEPLGAVAPLPGHGWLAAAGTGFVLLPAEGARDAEPRWLHRPASGAGPTRRMNDAVCDAAGRMWAGSMAYDNTEGAGSLYRLDPDGTVSEVVAGLTIPNGPAFSPDGTTLYLADSAHGHIDAFTLDRRSGALSERRPFARFTTDEGSPDGMVTDAHGRLWCAVWGAAQVRCYSPDGRLLTAVPLPAAQPTSVCLTGQRLLVTTAAVGLADPGPWDGAVLDIPCTAPPVPTPRASLTT